MRTYARVRMKSIDAFARPVWAVLSSTFSIQAAFVGWWLVCAKQLRVPPKLSYGSSFPSVLGAGEIFHSCSHQWQETLPGGACRLCALPALSKYHARHSVTSGFGCGVLPEEEDPKDAVVRFGRRDQLLGGGVQLGGEVHLRVLVFLVQSHRHGEVVLAEEEHVNACTAQNAARSQVGGFGVLRTAF